MTPRLDAGLTVLIALCALWSGAARADSLTFLGKFEWSTEAVTGLSGIEVSDDGRLFSAISDRGWFLSGQFQRDAQSIVGVELNAILPILGNDGLPVAARRVGDWSDAEGLAIAPDGGLWMSFERWAHVSRYNAPGAPGQWIKDHPSFSEFDENRQLEALAIHPDGTLYTFPEQPLRDGFPIYRLDNDVWSIDGYIAARDGFSIVGADFDETGTLYLLERKLSLGFWWQNRVRRLQVRPPLSDEILWTGARGEFNDMEGIAVWHDGVGRRLTMVSDDNGNRKEPTQFVEFRLNEMP